VFLLMMVAIAAKSVVLAIADRRGLLRGTALVEVVVAACWATAVVLMGGF